MSTLFDQFLSASAKSAMRPAYAYLGKETSYKDLRESIARLSYLYQNEIGPEAKVALLARNSPAWIKTFFALTNIRATVIPLDPDAPPSEWSELFKATQPTHVAITSDLLIAVREFLSSEHRVTPIIEIEKKQGGEYDTSFTAPAENKPAETDVILLLASGGRTAKPKVIQLNHKHLFGAASILKGTYKPLSTDRLHTKLTWAHPYSFVHGFLFPLMQGMTLVIDHGLEAVEYLDFLIQSRVTRLVGTPPYYLKLLITSKNEKKPPAGIKSASVGLGRLSNELRRVFQVLKIPAPHVYGMTEHVWTISMESIEDINIEPGVHGKPLPGVKYKVMDDHGDEIEGPERRVGLLAISGPAVMQGYLGKEYEKETKNALRGTWLYTGDIATLEGKDDELKFTYLGRKEDLVKVDGQYRSVDVVDSILRKIPGLQDAAAFAVKNSKNQVVVACALVKTQGSPVNEKQILGTCSKALPEDLHPKGIVFTDVIPRDTGGNVNYHRLRGQFSGIVG